MLKVHTVVRLEFVFYEKLYIINLYKTGSLTILNF